MKKWIAVFGLLIFISASVAPAIASVSNTDIVVVDFDKDPKKETRKADKKAGCAEKTQEAAGCGEKAAAPACETVKKSACCDAKEGKKEAVAEKK